MLKKTGLYDEKGGNPSPWMKIIICDYIARRWSKGLTGKWIAPGHFPHTASHVKAFQASAEEKIAERFRGNPEELRRRSAELGGYETERRDEGGLPLLLRLAAGILCAFAGILETGDGVKQKRNSLSTASRKQKW